MTEDPFREKPVSMQQHSMKSAQNKNSASVIRPVGANNRFDGTGFRDTLGNPYLRGGKEGRRVGRTCSRSVLLSRMEAEPAAFRLSAVAFRLSVGW
jgi:hypothetical protein